MKSLQFCLCEKSLFLLYFQRIILLDIDFQVDDFFSFNTLKISLHCLLSCMVSDAKSPVILIAVLLQVKCIFLLASFKIFLLVFLQFEYECLNIFVFVFIYPHWCSLDLWFDGVINLGKFSTIIASNISFVSLSLSSYSISVMCMLHLLMLSHNSWMLYFFPFLFFSLYTFHFRMFLLTIFKLTDSFLACVESTDEPTGRIFHFYSCV